MKRTLILMLALCLMLAGCGAAQEAPATTAATKAPTAAPETTAAQANVIAPLPDTTMSALDDSIAAVALEEGNIRVEESGLTVMYLQVYRYDMYDLVDMANLKEGDILLHCGEEIPVNALERTENGTLLINGGLDQGGLDLVTQEDGVYYAMGYSDMKSWYLAGEAMLEVSPDFVFTDSSDLDKGTVTYTAQDLIDGNPEIPFYFAPQNTTVRIQDGVVMAMDRIYTP